MADHFRKNIKKCTASQGELAKEFRDGVEAAFRETLTTGDDVYWTTLEFRRDSNGNMAWYVDLYACDQATYMSQYNGTPCMKYESVIVAAYWFEEGAFWVQSVNGYITNDGPDELEELESDHLNFNENDINEVVEALEMVAENYISQAKMVVIHVNGNEMKVMPK